MRDFEIEAVLKLAINARAVAKMLPKSDHAVRLMVWAQIAEEAMQRIANEAATKQ